MVLPVNLRAHRSMRGANASALFVALGAICLALIIADSPARGADGEAAPEKQSDASPDDALDARVQKLIEQLGAPQYATRERAQSELRRMGLTAFDALYEAQNHDDIEIALRAQYLVRSMTVDWANEDDPIEVKRILRGYGGKRENQRKTLMAEIAKLSDWAGVAALARLARFERSPGASKHAALLVMKQPFPSDEERRKELAERIEKTMQLSKRPAAQWLRAYADTLRDPAGALDQWRGLIEEEERTLEESPGMSDRQLVLDLLRWYAEFLAQHDRKSEAEDAMRRALALVQDSREQILETVDWLMAHERWSLVDELAGRYRETFENDSLLMYRLAEAQLRRGRKEVAEQTARRAFELLGENSQERSTVAVRLQERGLVEWAEREYRHILDQEPLTATISLITRQQLSMMLHDQERDLDAARVYQTLFDAMEKDPNVARGVDQVMRDLSGVRSRMHYYYSEHHRREQDYAKQREHLEKALEYDPAEPDSLIAAFRIPEADEAFRQKIRQLVQAATEQFRENVQTYRQQLERIANNDAARQQMELGLAMYDNQYAWLVCNTFGDFQEALRLSHESLELRPNTAAYLDTLAHCYHAVGDYENAVKYQKQAVEQEPHAGQIVRKLAFFQKELEESKKKPSK